MLENTVNTVRQEKTLRGINVTKRNTTLFLAGDIGTYNAKRNFRTILEIIT